MSADGRDWAYLASVSEPPASAVARLVVAVGVTDAARAVRSRRVPDGHEGVLTATAARCETDTARADLAVAERLGGRLLTPDDDEWPAWALHGLSTADTSVRGGPPLALWVRGDARLDSCTDAAVAIVGSRAASGYGTQVAQTLAAGAVDHGRCVVSGGAYGIDAAAHRAALAEDGSTVVVLACGIDVDYPAAHVRLFSEVVGSGLIVSEYSPGTSAARHRFLCRNRLIAGLSCGVVLVEAGRRSGAINTAAWARKLGLPLGAVPGSVMSATSAGTNALIADGHAQLVADVDALERLIAPDGTDARAERTVDTLDALSIRVRDAIPVRGTATVAEIAFASGIDVPRVRTVLARLEVDGHVEGDGASWHLPARSSRTTH